MKFTCKNRFGFAAQVWSRELKTTLAIGTYPNAERANMAARLYLFWESKFPEKDIPRKPTHADAFNSWGY